MSGAVNGFKKALFIQRFLAFMIDAFIILVLTSIISIPFVNNKQIEKLNNKSYELIEKMRDNDISSSKYITDYMNISYDLAKNNGMTTIISIFFGLIFYVVYPLHNKGQSIGKRLLKIKIVSENGVLTMNQLIFRSFIANSMLLDLLSVVLLLVTSKPIYLCCFGLFSVIQYMVTFISIFIKYINSKKGRAIHDIVARTCVVKEDIK